MRKAEADHLAVGKLNRGDAPLYDQVCFFCQQCAEKYLKSLLEELGLTVPYTHILGELLTLLLPYHPTLRSLRRGMKFLTRFAVGARYPGYHARKRETRAALAWADKVRDTARQLLGVRPLKARKKAP